LDSPIYNDETKINILEVIKKEKPESGIKLSQVLLEKYNISPELTAQILRELEEDDKLQFKQFNSVAPHSIMEYVFSRKAFWYLVIIAITLGTAVSAFVIPANIYPIAYLRNTLGLIYILIIPGYASIKALFPITVPFKTTRENMYGIERIALSLGMSLILIPLVGLTLNYTPWGITLTSTTLSLLILTLFFTMIALIREFHAKSQTLAVSN
jgi:hypothetical protein